MPAKRQNHEFNRGGRNYDGQHDNNVTITAVAGFHIENHEQQKGKRHNDSINEKFGEVFRSADVIHQTQQEKKYRAQNRSDIDPKFR